MIHELKLSLRPITEIPSEDIYFMGSYISNDCLLLTKDGDWLIGHYFFPWRNMDLEGWKYDSDDEEEIVAWCYLPTKYDIEAKILKSIGSSINNKE